MVYINVKKYEHYNRAMGKHISSKKEYVEEMKRGNYMDYDKAKALAELNRKKAFEISKNPSKKCVEIINSVKNGSDKKGNVKLSDRQIDAMKSMGMSFDIPKDIPTDKGGFK